MHDFQTLLNLSNRAFKNPSEVGEEMRTNYWFDVQDMAAIIAVATFILILPSILMYPHGIGFGLLLQWGVQFLFLWFVMPALDWVGYRIFQVQLTYQQAREMFVCALLPAVSPFWIGIVTVVSLLFSAAHLDKMGSLIFFCAWVGIYVQSVRIRKHMLGVSYTVAVLGNFLLPIALIIAICFALFFFIVRLFGA